MSLLTPAELATRGAMFLGESGNKSSSPKVGGSTANNKAKLTGLIVMCNNVHQTMHAHMLQPVIITKV